MCKVQYLCGTHVVGLTPPPLAYMIRALAGDDAEKVWCALSCSGSTALPHALGIGTARTLKEYMTQGENPRRHFLVSLAEIFICVDHAALDFSSARCSALLK